MKNEFNWVPFYEEMAKKLLSYRSRQRALVKILSDSGVGGLVDQNPKGNSIPLTEIDPFTFLALLNKQSYAERENILKTVKSELKINASVPTEFSGIPKSDPRQTWLFPYRFARKPDDIYKLWDLYEAVLSGKKLGEEVFQNARSVKYAGHAKLTQAIFRAAPSKFFPVDGQTIGYLARLGLPNKFNSAKEFQDICAQVANKVKKPLYEQSYDAWLHNQKNSRNAEAEYQRNVLRKAASARPVVERKGGVPVPTAKKAGTGTGSGYQRNPSVAATALSRSDFKCEIDPTHQTFISNSKDKPYVEAHHLIPFSNQGSYKFSLDVTANIVSLCPNCHRLLHHGKSADKAEQISALFARRKDELLEKELKISETDLLKLYRGELLEEDA